MKTAKRSRSREFKVSPAKEPMTVAQIKEMQKKFEKETGVDKPSRPSSLPKVKTAWGGKRKTAKRRRAKKSCGWFW